MPLGGRQDLVAAKGHVIDTSAARDKYGFAYHRLQFQPEGAFRRAGDARPPIARVTGELPPVHGEFVITLRLASGTDRGNDTAKRSDQGRHGRAAVRQIFLLECRH